ncbi:MAG: hypothetical protein LC720_04100, partial [Actinobacteria bacterium]|nr:hypothetical protein [Actinomycetota bacterium]
MDYKWFRDNTSTQVFDATNGFNNAYTPAAADLGHSLICQETVMDFSTPGGAQLTADSAPSGPTVPTPGVAITQYSPAVSGDIGESVAGVTVTVGLQRATGVGTATREVASGTATTNADGVWIAILKPVEPASGPSHGFGVPGGFGLPGDQMTTHYAPPAAAPATTVPLDHTFGGYFVNFAGGPSTISADGSTVFALAGPCTSVAVVVDGVPHATSASPSGAPGPSFGCSFAPVPHVTDADHVQVAVLRQVPDAFALGPASSVANLTTVSDVGLLGVARSSFNFTSGAGSPTCSGDLVSGQVTCSNLSGATFSVARNGAAPVALATQPEAVGE